MINTTVGEYLAVLVELKLSANEAVRELARFNGERAHVPSDLLTVFLDAAAEDDLEYTVAGLVFRTEDEPDEVGRDGERGGRRCRL